uniref:Uncharacterized protein n=1 Tax=Anguilla anguilla TaxID=7936 RepID=A0A0E9P5G3_ANGAN
MSFFLVCWGLYQSQIERHRICETVNWL